MTIIFKWNSKLIVLNQVLFLTLSLLWKADGLVFYSDWSFSLLIHSLCLYNRFNHPLSVLFHLSPHFDCLVWFLPPFIYFTLTLTSFFSFQFNLFVSFYFISFFLFRFSILSLFLLFFADFKISFHWFSIVQHPPKIIVYLREILGIEILFPFDSCWWLQKVP